MLKCLKDIVHDRPRNILTNLSFFVSIARLWLRPYDNPVLSWYEEKGFDRKVVRFYFAHPPIPSIPISDWDTVAAMVMVDLINARFILPIYIFDTVINSKELAKSTIIPLMLSGFIVISGTTIGFMNTIGQNYQQIILTYTFLVSMVSLILLASALLGTVVRLRFGFTLKTNNLIYTGLGLYVFMGVLLFPVIKFIDWVISLHNSYLFFSTAAAFIVIAVLLACKMLGYVFDLIQQKRTVS